MKSNLNSPNNISTPDVMPLSLTKISDGEILTRLERLSRTERKITHLVLWHLLEVDARKLYLKLNYDSLYQYLTKHLGYSESSAYDRIQAARVLKAAPEITTKLEEGSLKLSQLVKVEQSLKQEKRAGHVVNAQKTQELLSKLENKTSFETEKILAWELNQTPRTSQHVKPQKDESVRLEFTLTQEQYEILKKAQSLISHAVPENNLADVITYLAQNLIRRKEGKASTQGFRLVPLENKPTISPVKPYPRCRSKRAYISVKIKRLVMEKAQGFCEHVNHLTEKRCSSRYQLQTDHRIPLACGGSNEPENLRLLCGVHNRREALRWGLLWPGLRRP